MRWISTLLLICSANALAASADAPPGATACSGCHGAGRPGSPVPGLYGRPAETTVALLAAFRNGTRTSTVMGAIAKGFTDEEMRAIAIWLESQK